ncbi:MAG: UDP-N-acetylmuramate--L-alanine ligase [Firmicutes bacterium]|nr:UDP-N-acetylmuramate--L-alanine ligase [Alicyclobacillaceae bacterium]MCL6497450.1 UDP-N-acetylmuramate--L-alanine ligase [Bacillota bacterium]
MRHVHFIGIGGYSMSGLALVLHRQGLVVTGSDLSPSSRTERLRREGVTVFSDHRAEHLAGADTVVFNSDVPADNPERVEAVRRGLTLLHRSELLAQVLAPYRAVTVSGTHGKTTTTTMIGMILAECGFDPLVLIGGESPYFGGNVRMGQGSWAVAEADESDGSFLRYRPEVAVATNVEPEHLEHYAYSFDRLADAFSAYLAQVPSQGLRVWCADDPTLARIGVELGPPGVGYGFAAQAAVRAEVVAQDQGGTRFAVFVEGVHQTDVHLPVPGRHNVANALAAMVACHHLGVSWDKAAEVLERYQSVKRRFQRLFEGEVLVVDDYAHHPTEIRATLKAARQVTRGRLLAIFQPQRFVRTQNLWDQFVGAFDEADAVYLTEIYAPAGERPLPGISAERLADAIRRGHPGPVYYTADMMALVPQVLRDLQPRDTVLTMGAGNIFRVAEALSERLRQGSAFGLRRELGL